LEGNERGKGKGTLEVGILGGGVDGARSGRRRSFEVLVENVVDSLPILRFGSRNSDGNTSSFFIHP